MAAFDPLHDPGEATPEHASLAVEIAVTRRILNETAALNIHDDNDMRSAAFALNARIRSLLAAVEAERGRAR
jgi:hypothetical protein